MVGLESAVLSLFFLVDIVIIETSTEGLMPWQCYEQLLSNPTIQLYQSHKQNWKNAYFCPIEGAIVRIFLFVKSESSKSQ